MNKKYFLALASVAVSVAIYSCGSGDVVDFYNDDIDGVPGQAMLDEMNFTNTLQDESVVNNYKDKYGNGSVPPPESSSSVEPEPTDTTTGGEIPLSSSAAVPPLSSSSQGIILPPVSSGEDGSSSSSPEEVPLSSSSAPTPELSSSSSIGVTPQSSSANTPTPVSSSSVATSAEGDVIEITAENPEVTLNDGTYNININVSTWPDNKTHGTFSCNGKESTTVAIDIGGVPGSMAGYYSSVANVPGNGASGTITVTNGPATCQIGW